MIKRKIIVNSNCYHGYSVFDALKGIKDAGFHNVELTATKGWTEHVFPTHSFSDLLKVRNYIEKLGLSVPSFSGHTNIMDEERLPIFFENVALADFFGAKTIVTSIGEAHLKDKRKGGTDIIRESIDKIIPYLEKYDMSLSLETHGDHSTGSIIKEIIKDYDKKRIGICYDTANVIFYGAVKDTEDLKESVDYVNYLHIKDKAGKEKEWNFPALGKGWVDFPSIFKVLDESGNNSSLSIEIEFTEKGSSSLDEVNETVRESAEYLKGLGYDL